MIERLIKTSSYLRSRGLIEEADALKVILKEAWVNMENHPAHPGDVSALSKSLDDFDNNEEAQNWMQAGLAVLGLIPVVGEPFDGLNTGIYASRGRSVDAILSAISVIPIYGDIVGKGTQLLLLAINKGYKTVAFGNKTYTIAGLATFIKDRLDKINEPEVKHLLDTVDEKMNKRKGTLYGMYVKDIKQTVYNAASGSVPV